MTDNDPEYPARTPAPPPSAVPTPSNPHDEVDEASEESFPASDPPSWEPLHSGTPTPPQDETPDAGT